MTRYRIFGDEGSRDIEATRILEPGSPGDVPVTIEARFTFDGLAEYEECSVDGVLAGVRVRPLTR